ncbi:hypothetical protein ATANTOWER_017901, partial [Ataeniobius toweri]|nr:hypothetical protein [Ataeniobius toweri]
TGVTPVRQRGIYVQVQMEVTGDLSCGVSRLSNCRTIDCFDNEPQLFVLISSSLMLFPKCGHLLAEGPGAYNVACFFFSPFLFNLFFSLSSKCQLCAATAQSSHPRSFVYLQVGCRPGSLSQLLSQWVICV